MVELFTVTNDTPCSAPSIEVTARYAGSKQPTKPGSTTPGHGNQSLILCCLLPGPQVAESATNRGRLCGLVQRNCVARCGLHRIGHGAHPRAGASAGFDYFSIGVPDRVRIQALADHLTDLGDKHAGVQFATIGWILPMLHDPDGHEVRFYSMDAHTDIDPASPLVIDDAIASARVKERVWLAERAGATGASGVGS